MRIRVGSVGVRLGLDSATLGGARPGKVRLSQGYYRLGLVWFRIGSRRFGFSSSQVVLDEGGGGEEVEDEGEGKSKGRCEGNRGCNQKYEG